MKVTQWVDYGGGEVEVELSVADIIEAMRECSVNADSLSLIQRSLVDYYHFLKAIPDEMIAELSPQAQQVVHQALTAQVARFTGHGGAHSIEMMSDDDLHMIERFTNQSSPEPWVFCQADSQSIEEHLEFMSDLLARTIGQDALWYVATPQEGKAPEDHPLVVAITGNGRLSQENAQFITMARGVIPRLLQDRVQVRHLLYVLQLVYRKHVLSDDSIGWSELEDKVQTALAEAMGDKAFSAWLTTVAPDGEDI